MPKNTKAHNIRPGRGWSGSGSGTRGGWAKKENLRNRHTPQHTHSATSHRVAVGFLEGRELLPFNTDLVGMRLLPFYTKLWPVTFTILYPIKKNCFGALRAAHTHWRPRKCFK